MMKLQIVGDYLPWKYAYSIPYQYFHSNKILFRIVKIDLNATY